MRHIAKGIRLRKLQSSLLCHINCNSLFNPQQPLTTWNVMTSGCTKLKKKIKLFSRARLAMQQSPRCPWVVEVAMVKGCDETVGHIHRLRAWLLSSSLLNWVIALLLFGHNLICMIYWKWNCGPIISYLTMNGSELSWVTDCVKFFFVCNKTLIASASVVVATVVYMQEKLINPPFYMIALCWMGLLLLPRLFVSNWIVVGCILIWGH